MSMTTAQTEAQAKEFNIHETPKETFGSSIDFKNLFRVKGHKGLYYLLSMPNKAGYCGLQEFLGANKIQADKKALEQLERFIFYKTTGEPIGLAQVFDNMNFLSIEGLKALTESELMSLMVPDYDPERFKPYHAAKVIAWYSEIKTKIKNLS